MELQNDHKYNDRISRREMDQQRFTFMTMNVYSLFLREQHKILQKNNSNSYHKNHIPVAYLSVDEIGIKFLITELDTNGSAFGLIDCDASPRICSVNMLEFTEKYYDKYDITPKFGFSSKYPLAVYAKVADEIGTLVIDDTEMSFKNEFEKFAVPEYLDQDKDISFLKKEVGYMFERLYLL